MSNELIVYNSTDKLAEWFSDNFDANTSYDIFHIYEDDKEKCRGLSYTRITYVDVSLTVEDKDVIEFLNIHLRSESTLQEKMNYIIGAYSK